jgi:hypothetical protein
MNDPLLQKAADLKKLTDDAKSDELDAHMAEIMKILLEATQPKRTKQ